MAVNQVIIFKAKDAATGKIREVSVSMNKLNKIMGKAGKTADATNRKMKGSTNIFKSMGKAAISLRGILLTLGAAYVVASGIRILKDLNATADSFELLKIKLDNLMGSARAGKEAFKFIIDFAETTPLSVRELTDAFVKMKAFGLDPMDGSMRAIVDQTAKISGGQKEMGNIILAVGQMWTEQKVRGQEVRQLMQQAVPVYKILADQMGITASAVKKLGEEGNLGSQAVRDLIKGMGEAASGSAAIQMTTFTGLWNNFVDQIELAKDEFAGAEKGLLSFTKALTDKGIAVLKEFRESGDLAKWGEDFSSVLISLTLTILETAKTLVQLGIELGVIVDAGVKIKRVFDVKNLIEVSPFVTALRVLQAEFQTTGNVAEKSGNKIIATIDKFIKATKQLKGAIKGAAQEKLGRKILSDAQAGFKQEELGRSILKKAQDKFKGLIPDEVIPKISEKENLKNLNNQKALIALQSEFLPKTEFSALFQNELALKRLDIEEQIALVKAGALGGSGGLLEDISASFDEKRDAVIDSERQTQADKLLAQFEADSQLQEAKEAHELKMDEIGQKHRQDEIDALDKAEKEKMRLRKQSFDTAINLANAFFIISGSKSKALFNVTKALNLAETITATYTGATKALALTPPNFPLAAAITASGLANAARIASTKLGSGGSGGGGGSGGTAPSISSPTGFPSQQQNQGSTINLTINAVDSKSFLDNVDEVLEPIAEKLADHLGANGSSGQFNFVLERS